MSALLWIVGAIALWVIHRQAYPKQHKLPKGRLVPRSQPYVQHVTTLEELAQRELQAQQDHERQERFDAARAEYYKYECAMRAWHAGFGEHPSFPKRNT